MHDEPAWRRYLRFHRADPAGDLDDELRDHLESLQRELASAGMSPDEARAEARRRFGNVERVRTDVLRLDAAHDTRRRPISFLDVLWQDVRFALRQLARSPGFALVATLSIALGIAANVTIFSVANVLLLRPIGGARAEGLVRVYRDRHSPLQYRDLVFFRERATSLSAMVAERNEAMVMRASGEPERVQISMVTQHYFQTLDVPMTLGRAFSGDERIPAGGEGAAVVLSHAFWRGRFGADPGIIGRQISLNGRPMTVVGVANKEFASSVLGWAPSLWLPLAESPLLTGEPLSDYPASMYVTARLAPGVNAARAQGQLAVITRQLAATDTAAYARMTVRIDHMRGVEAEMRGALSMVALFLMVVVTLVLLIACANVANLLLARSAARHTEIGVRLAIGASRGRIVRQLLTESVVLSIGAGVLGFVLATTTVPLLQRPLPAEALTVDVSPDMRVLVYTASICLFGAVAFGLAPALRASRPDLVTALKSESTRGSFRRSRLRSGLVVTQAALSVLLLVVASFFLRSLHNASNIDPGFRITDIRDIPMDLGSRRLEPDRMREQYGAVLEQSSGIPGARGSALAALVPLAGNNMQTPMLPQGMTPGSVRDWPVPYFNVVSPGYFALLDIPLPGGREFLPSDDERAPTVAIVNETAARQWWPGANPLGMRIRLRDDASGAVVVGVARDIKYNSLGESTPPFVYFPFAQHPRMEMVLQLAITGDAAALRSAVWEMTRGIDPALPPPPVRTLAEDIRVSVLPARIGATLLGAFGLLALLLATAGVYGVTSFSVAQRTREIGIRTALGAARMDIMRLVVGETMRLVLAGTLLGIAGAVAIGYAAAALLYGVSPREPTTLLAAPLLLCVVALLASFIPARRAAAVHPMAAIRAN